MYFWARENVVKVVSIFPKSDGENILSQIAGVSRQNVWLVNISLCWKVVKIWETPSDGPL